jgi:hypothetical protein
MKKQVFIFLALLGTSKLGAETLIQYCLPTLFGFVSGRLEVLNVFDRNEGDPMPVIYSLPFEIRQTIAKFPVADLMAAGGLSFYFEDKALTSINLSGGLTFGYGYHENEHFLIFRNMNITLYPLYEFPLAVSGGSPIFPWKFAIDLSFELMQIQPKSLKFGHITPISISLYAREMGVYGKNRVLFFLPDCGLTIGLVF